jgi:hypothetical protein
LGRSFEFVAGKAEQELCKLGRHYECDPQ